MEAYFDNSATTKAYKSVSDIMTTMLLEDYGNPSSKHMKGYYAEERMKEAASKIAKTLKVSPKELIFTSGGTESNNLAVIGAALGNKRKGNHILASSFEHPSVYNPLLALEELGFTVEFVPVDENGHIREDLLLSMIKTGTIMFSCMMVNNEIGAVQDIARISALIKEKKPDIIFHVDAIQAYGKYMIEPRKLGIDLLSVSGHKIHGPKGSGFLYIKEKLKLKPVIYGGEQQRGLRSGTENVPAIAGIGQAALETYTDFEKKREHMYRLKEYFIDRVTEFPGVYINGIGTGILNSAPHIVSVSFEGVKSEVLLHALEEDGIYVSSGSACSSNHPGISGTLKAIGLRNDLLDSTLRFSFCESNTFEEIDYAMKSLAKLLPVLRRFRHV